MPSRQQIKHIKQIGSSTRSRNSHRYVPGQVHPRPGSPRDRNILVETYWSDIDIEVAVFSFHIIACSFSFHIIACITWKTLSIQIYASNYFWFFYFVIITLFILKAVMDKNIYLAKFFVITYVIHTRTRVALSRWFISIICLIILKFYWLYVNYMLTKYFFSSYNYNCYKI